MNELDQTYRRASDGCGESSTALQNMAKIVFASMLNHAMSKPGQFVKATMRIDGGEINFEVTDADGTVAFCRRTVRKLERRR